MSRRNCSRSSKEPDYNLDKPKFQRTIVEMNQPSSSQSVPEYVDTETPKRKWYTYHLLIGLFSLAMALVAAMVLEYEIAKLTHPNVGYIVTPVKLDIALSSLIIL